MVLVALLIIMLTYPCLIKYPCWLVVVFINLRVDTVRVGVSHVQHVLDLPGHRHCDHGGQHHHSPAQHVTDHEHHDHCQDLLLGELLLTQQQFENEWSAEHPCRHSY